MKNYMKYFNFHPYGFDILGCHKFLSEVPNREKSRTGLGWSNRK